MSVLPRGAVIHLDEQCTWLDPQTLIGGSPARLFRLSDAARALLAGGSMTVRDTASAVLATRLLRAGAARLVLASVAQPGRDEVTVVVPVHGRPASLGRLLDSLPIGCAEVIVVDDASPPADAAAIAALVTARPGHRVLRLGVNRGPGAARNAGLRAANTRYVLFADSDVVLDPGVVDRLLRHFADPALAVVAPRVRALDVADRGWLARYEQGASALDMGPASAVVAPRSAVGWVPSACWLVAAEQLGEGFDERLRIAEDVDLCWRLTAGGVVVRYDAEATVRHDHRVRWGGWLLRRFHYGTGATPLARRHPASVAPAVLTPWSAIFVAALAMQRRASVPIALGALLVGWLGLARRLPGDLPGERLRQAAVLSGRGAATALDQGSALTLRHWWPVSAALCLASRRARRLVVAAVVLDGVRARRRGGVPLDPARHLIARRLDDLAYGAGLWASAWRGRSVRALLPETVRGSRSSGSGQPAR